MGIKKEGKIMIKKNKTAFSTALAYFLENSPDEKTTQGQLADRIKKSQTYISMLKHGKRNGSEKTRRDIAAFFEKNYQDFLDIGKNILLIAHTDDKKGFLKTQSIQYSLDPDAPIECNDAQRHCHNHEPLPDFFRNNNHINNMLKDIQKRDPGDIKSIIDYIRYIHDRKKP
jgi:transcriptional regulator with XRE-family HTH domain